MNLEGRDLEDCGLRPVAAKCLQDPISINRPDVVVHAHQPSYMGGINKRIMVLTDLGKNKRFCSKLTQSRRGWGVFFKG
jgi:hypothetical protein